MEDFRTLKILDRFSSFFNKLGVDYPVMRKILQIKLLMDQRRVPTIFSQGVTKKKRKVQEEGNAFFKSLWIYAFIGLFTIPFIAFGNNYIYQMSIVMGILMFIVMTSMISDFSSVLLDIRDKNILHTKPIDKKTISVAKLVHVFIYLFFLTASIITIPLIVSIFTKGIVFFLISVFNILLLEVLIVVLTALIYILIMKFFDGEKLKDIINYVQIGLSLAIMIGYQLLGRSFDIINLHVVFIPKWWHIFIIPMWYGAPFELFLNRHFDYVFILFSVLGVVVPIAAFIIYLRLVASFEKNLQKLAIHSTNKERKRSRFGKRLISIICSRKEEQAFYRFASLMMKNERDFKLKVYPSLGFSIILPFIFLFNVVRMHDYTKLSSGNGYLTIYFSMLIIPNVVMMLKFSGRYKGAWIYKTVPLNNLSPLFKGTLKAFLIRLYLPVYLLLSFIFVGIFGIRLLPDLFLVLLNSFFYTAFCFLVLKRSIPFSESFDSGGQTESWKTILLFIPIGILAGIHVISTHFEYGIYAYIIVMLIVNLFLWRKRIGA